MTAPDPGQESDRDAASKLIRLAEGTVAMAGVGALFGYISMRAHLNTLGISSAVALGFERYLMELYLFIMDAFLGPAVALLWTALPVSCILAVLPTRHRLAAERIRSPNERGQFWILTATAVCLFVAYWIAAVTTSRWLGIRLIGPIRVPDNAWDSRPWPFFYALVAICSASTLVCFWMRASMRATSPGNRVGLPAYLWRLVTLALALLWVHVPIFYGVVLHRTDYPQVEVHVNDGADSVLCGLLVLDTDTDIRIWRATSGERNGIVQVVSREQGLVWLRQGPAQDLLLTAERVSRGNTTPECEINGTGGKP